MSTILVPINVWCGTSIVYWNLNDLYREGPKIIKILNNAFKLGQPYACELSSINKQKFALVVGINIMNYTIIKSYYDF